MASMSSINHDNLCNSEVRFQHITTNISSSSQHITTNIIVIPQNLPIQRLLFKFKSKHKAPRYTLLYKALKLGFDSFKRKISESVAPRHLIWLNTLHTISMTSIKAQFKGMVTQLFRKSTVDYLDLK